MGDCAQRSVASPRQQEWSRQQESVARNDGLDDDGSGAIAIPWHSITGLLDLRWQWGPVVSDARAMAAGPKTGTTITNSSSLAIHRCIVFCNAPRPDGEENPRCNQHSSIRYLMASCRVPAAGMRYHSFVHELADRLLRTIRKKALIKPGDRVAAAVSGGADSVALLLLLLELRAELGMVLSVAHVNHKLRGEESEKDEQFVAELARQHGLQMYAHAAPVGKGAGAGIEAAARHLRYDYFRQLAREGRVSKIATAHTIDDQAETVLLRILRGAGIRGLSGIHPRLQLKAGPTKVGEVVRPLLYFHRHEVGRVVLERGQPWREDSSNDNPAFLRNRVRHQVLPLLKANFGPGAVDNLADLAEIARAEEEHWASCHPEILVSEDTVRSDRMRALPLAARRRLVQNWLGRKAPGASVTLRLIEELLDLAAGPAGGKVELPGGGMMRKTQQGILLAAEGATADYEYRCAIPGHVDVSELGMRIEVVKLPADETANSAGEQCLDASRLPGTVTIRNWRAGDRFWPAHTKEPKKVKELLADRHVAGSEKKLWPVVVAEGLGVIWVRGFAVPEALRAAGSVAEAVCIQEERLAGAAPVNDE